MRCCCWPKPQNIMAGILRFVINIPFGIFAGMGLTDYMTLNSHADVLLAAPLDRERTLLILRMAGPGVRIPSTQFASGFLLTCVALQCFVAFLYNLLVWIPNIVSPAPLHLVLGTIDVGIVALLAFTIAYEYIGLVPQPKSICDAVVPIGANATGSDPRVLLFDRMNVHNDTLQWNDSGGQISAAEVCWSLVWRWGLGVAVLGLYFILTIMNVIVGIRAVFYDEKHGSHSSHDGTSRGGIPIHREPYFIIRWIVRTPWTLIKSCFPEPKRIWCHYHKRALLKWISHRKAASNFASFLRWMKTHHFHSMNTQDPPLLRALNFDILAQLAKELHYADLVSLSLTSRRACELVFLGTLSASPPARQDNGATRLLKRYTCAANSERCACWACGIQICSDCTTTHPVTTSHAIICKPACRTCMLTSVFAQPNPSPGRACVCTAHRTHHVNGTYIGPRWRALRSLCSTCCPSLADNNGNDTADHDERAFALDRRRMLRRRDWLVKRIKTGEHIKCAFCEKDDVWDRSSVISNDTPGGRKKREVRRSKPWWWVCTCCGEECKSAVHPGWMEDVSRGGGSEDLEASKGEKSEVPGDGIV